MLIQIQSKYKYAESDKIKCVNIRVGVWRTTLADPFRFFVQKSLSHTHTEPYEESCCIIYLPHLAHIDDHGGRKYQTKLKLVNIRPIVICAKIPHSHTRIYEESCCIIHWVHIYHGGENKSETKLNCVKICPIFISAKVPHTHIQTHTEP